MQGKLLGQNSPVRPVLWEHCSSVQEIATVILYCALGTHK